jgi:hypothetical protein
LALRTELFCRRRTWSIGAAQIIDSPRVGGNRHSGHQRLIIVFSLEPPDCENLNSRVIGRRSPQDFPSRRPRPPVLESRCSFDALLGNSLAAPAPGGGRSQDHARLPIHGVSRRAVDRWHSDRGGRAARRRQGRGGRAAWATSSPGRPAPARSSAPAPPSLARSALPSDPRRRRRLRATA